MIRLALVSLFLTVPLIALGQTLVGLDKNTASLHTIDLDDASTIEFVEITLDTDAFVLGGTGLAVHPTTGALYAILKIDGQTGRSLASIDPATGEGEEIGDTGLSFATIAFDPDGVLYGVTGNGEAVGDAETLFTIDLDDASTEAVCALGADADGEALGYSPDDESFIRASGWPVSILEFVDDLSVDPCGTTAIDISGEPIEDHECMAMTWWDDEGVFLMQYSHEIFSLYEVTTDGEASLVGETDAHFKGLAFVDITPLGPEFLRGDVDSDGIVDGMRDALALLVYVFRSGPVPGCMDAADADNNGEISGPVDALYLLNWNFALGAAPEDPGTVECGLDPEQDLGCKTEPSCP